MSPLAPRAS